MLKIGIDNGVTGTIGFLHDEEYAFYHMPVFKSLNYQKSKVKYLNRVDVKALSRLIKMHVSKEPSLMSVKAYIERPMVNPSRFEATTSALRALEAVLITLEVNEVPRAYIDSKDWQKAVLPYIKVADKKKYPTKLKEVSKQVGQRNYPNIDWTQFSDADGILIAKYAKEMEN